MTPVRPATRRLHPTKFSYGGTAAVITDLALIMTLHATPNARSQIISGVLVIALADNISDALAIHVYQDAADRDRRRSVVNTLWNFLARLLVSLVFIALVVVLPMPTAAIASGAFGLAVLALITYEIARDQRANPWLMITEHVLVAVVVITASNYLGRFISSRFH
jgi:vacuolar iron transporter family protein